LFVNAKIRALTIYLRFTSKRLHGYNLGVVLPSPVNLGDQRAMEIVLDPDVQAVAEFMQQRMQASRLVAVANGLAGIAPLLWGRYQREEIHILQLQDATSTLVPRPSKQSIASE
jgi:hypothetical protein